MKCMNTMSIITFTRSQFTKDVSTTLDAHDQHNELCRETIERTALLSQLRDHFSCGLLLKSPITDLSRNLRDVGVLCQDMNKMLRVFLRSPIAGPIRTP